MKITQAMKMAISAVRSNKMRSFLTMLGIIIGVLSVTLLVSLVQGATGSVTDSLNQLGGNQLTVSIMNAKKKLGTMELESLKGKGAVKSIAPYLNGSGIAKADGNSKEVTLLGITPDYKEFSEMELVYGRELSEVDNEYRLNVCVLGNKVAKELFGDDRAVGNQVRLLGRDFLVAGVLEEQGQMSFNSTDSLVYIPFTTAQRLLQSTGVTSFYASATTEEDLTEAQETLDAFLLAKTGNEDYYRIMNMANVKDTISTVTGALSMLLAGIAGISLVVGGIGIMNIMLVSVTERTKEIGIRKAIGAQRNDIVVQFMIESVTLSVMGGLIGMLLSAVILQMLNAFLPDYHFALSGAVAALALGFSMTIGLIFGIYPARKAANLKPIDALRFE